jgi:zinc-ribbon domain
MICTTCNADNRDGARFCTNCARSFSASPLEGEVVTQYPTMRGRPDLIPNRAGSGKTWLLYLPPLWHLYHGAIGKGLLVLVLYVIGLGLDFTVLGAPVGLLIMIGAAIWAIRDAKKLEAAHEEHI